ncbi:copper resistance protein CopC [Nocardioides sp. ChNu-153]|uniref:copper resistance CopC family protein n=1 Tax=unclassified Nocardioides TaxID=2615069 RepID=UPI0024066C5E|nr:MULTISPECIES: copper resistance CopC family protein [unclassified Nocardioides]MDF9714857.1 copper resistance protein CopC [Nocardioides sp. ChNu-99]MDN7120017.1 copper resistance protein CopC [Nocardioides sp. ChNu-153]
MSRTPPATRRPPRFLPTALLATLLAATVSFFLACAAPTPSYAHTDLVSSDPADGAQLEQAPREVALTFSEEMDPALSAVVLTVADRVAERVTVTSGSSPTVVLASLPEVELPAGRPATGAPAETPPQWRVDYRVVSRDGHPVAGSITFTSPVHAPAAAPPTAGTPAPTDAEGPDGPAATSTPANNADGSGSGSGWRGPALVLGLASLLLAAGAGAVVRRVRR